MANPAVSAITPWFTTLALNSSEMRYALQAAGAASSTDPLIPEIGVLPGGTASGIMNAGKVASSGSAAVTVQPFQAVLQHVNGPTYFATYSAALTVDVTANATSTNRYDSVIAEILDSELTGSGTKVAQIRVITGNTSAGGPTRPAGSVELARLLVKNSTITVTDQRLYARMRGGVRLASSLDTRNGSYPGDLRVFADGHMDVWTGSAWTTSVSPVVWSSFTPVLHYSGSVGQAAGTVNLGTGAVTTARYMLTGKRLDLSYTFVFGTTGMDGGSGDITTTLPPGILARSESETHILAFLYTGAPSLAAWGGTGYVSPGTSLITPRFPTSNSNCQLLNFRAATGPGVPATGVPYIPGNYPIGPESILTLNGTIEVQ